MGAQGELLELEEVVRILQKQVGRAGTQAEWARQNQVNPHDLSSAVRSKRPPTKDILRALNLRKAFGYKALSAQRHELLRVEDVARLIRQQVANAGGQTEWAERLKQALGTTSGAFVDASLYQLQAAAQLPGSGISEIAVNAALAMIEAAAPKDEIEGALAVQMACTHTAAMAVISRLGNGYPGEGRVAAFGSAAARLLRAYTCEVELLRRLRHGGRQYVRVEHVHVNDGAQAVIGNVGAPTGSVAARKAVRAEMGGA